MDDHRGENPLSVDSLAAETERGSDSFSNLPARLERYERAKARALSMRDYIASVPHLREKNLPMLVRLHECGSMLIFRKYLMIDKAKLRSARFCKNHLICPFCAIRRGAKMMARYLERVEIVLSEKPHLTPWMVTFTVKNGESLEERYAHLHNAVKRYGKYRHLDRGHEICKADGAVWSYEFKRGSGSGTWHPHMHAVWLCSSPLDAKKLADEWHQVTGDSFIVEAHPMYGENVDAFAEVFKYALKFGDMTVEDNWEAAEIMKGKRLVRSSGSLWGVEVPEYLEDDELPDDIWVDVAYRFFEEDHHYRPRYIIRSNSGYIGATIDEPVRLVKGEGVTFPVEYAPVNLRRTLEAARERAAGPTPGARPFRPAS